MMVVQLPQSYHRCHWQCIKISADTLQGMIKDTDLAPLATREPTNPPPAACPNTGKLLLNTLERSQPIDIRYLAMLITPRPVDLCADTALAAILATGKLGGSCEWLAIWKVEWLMPSNAWGESLHAKICRFCLSLKHMHTTER